MALINWTQTQLFIQSGSRFITISGILGGCMNSVFYSVSLHSDTFYQSRTTNEYKNLD